MAPRREHTIASRAPTTRFGTGYAQRNQERREGNGEAGDADVERDAADRLQWCVEGNPFWVPGLIGMVGVGVNLLHLDGAPSWRGYGVESPLDLTVMAVAAGPLHFRHRAVNDPLGGNDDGAVGDERTIELGADFIANPCLGRVERRQQRQAESLPPLYLHAVGPRRSVLSLHVDRQRQNEERGDD